MSGKALKKEINWENELLLTIRQDWKVLGSACCRNWILEHRNRLKYTDSIIVAVMHQKKRLKKAKRMQINKNQSERYVKSKPFSSF